MGQQDPGDPLIKKEKKKQDPGDNPIKKNPGGRAREAFQELRFYCCKAASRSGAKVMMMMLRILMMTMMETQMMTMMMIAERAPPGLSSRLHWVDFVRTDGNCDYKAKEEVNMIINITIINNIKILCPCILILIKFNITHTQRLLDCHNVHHFQCPGEEVALLRGPPH